MNGKGNIITNLIILASGIVLCILCNRPNVLHTIIFVTGIMFIVPALVNMVLLFGRPDNGEMRPSYTMRIVGWITSIAGIILGIFLVAMPDYFAAVLVYLFGGVLALGSLMQIYMLARGYHPVKFPVGLYVAPVIVLIGGVVMLCLGHGKISDFAVTLMMGTGMILFALTSFATMILLRSIARKHKAIARHAGESDSNNA